MFFDPLTFGVRPSRIWLRNLRRKYNMPVRRSSQARIEKDIWDLRALEPHPLVSALRAHSETSGSMINRRLKTDRHFQVFHPRH
jgi:hypothetical protein